MRLSRRVCVCGLVIVWAAVGAGGAALPEAQHRYGRTRPAFDRALAPQKAGVFETPDELGLATPALLATFDRKTGELAHVIHRASGRDFVEARAPRPLFQLSLTNARTRQTVATDTVFFRTIRVEKSGPASLALRFENHEHYPLTALVTAALGDDGLVHLRLSVTNRSEWAIASLRFPQMVMPAPLGNDAADDALLLPGFGGSDGAVLPAPAGRTQRREAVYPGAAFVQFAAYYDKAAGLYWAAQDPDGHCKRWELQAVKDQSVEMPMAHLVPELPGRDVALPYDVVLGAFTGDWHDAADLYKTWAAKQTWCAKTLAQRTDIPAFLKEGAGVIIMTGIPRDEAALKAYLDRLPQLLAEYKKRTGFAHMILVPYGWENRGAWAGINYFPARPSDEAWRKVNAALRAQGDRTALVTSGFWWVVKRKATSNGPAFDDTADFERRRGLCVAKTDGSTWTQDNYDLVGVHTDWRGLSVKLCHGSPEARDTMRRIFLDAARLGAPLVSFDQEIGGGQSAPCYSTTHGHPPGYGAWMWTDFRDLCQAILKEGKPFEPELGLFMENTSELAIPYMATYWSRQFGEVDHGAVGARGIGLFSYLYHEYVTAIGAACVQGQGERGAQPSAGLRYYVLANNVVRGLIPGPFMQEVPLESKDEWHKTVARAYFSYGQPYARFPEYLMLGVTCRPPTVVCGQHEEWFYRTAPARPPQKAGGAEAEKVAVSLPNVSAGRFVAADGSAGTVLVNTTAGPQQATVRLEAAAKSAVLYTADRREEHRWDAPPAGHEVPVSLEPFGVRVLVVR